MRFSTRHFFGVACLNVLLALGSGACSSQQDEDSEDLESSQEEGQENGGDEEGGNGGQQAQANEGEDNFSSDNMDNSTGDPAVNGAQEQAGGQNDLQEFISDAGQANNPTGQGQATTPVNQAEAQTVPAANAASANPVPAPQPMADTSTTSTGGVVAGLAGTPAGQGLPELGSKIPYVVRTGDTLGKIATKVYGSPARYKEIATLSGLDDPNHIYPGDVVYFQLTQEAVAFAQAYMNVPRQEIVVQQGDTLATISKRAFGSPRFWKSIWRENDHITNPDQLVVGQTVFYVTESAMSAATGMNDETIATVNLETTNEVALDLLDAQLDKSSTTNDFDFETVEMELSGDMITVNLGHSSAKTTVSVNS